jgi:hypothetical protein
MCGQYFMVQVPAKYCSAECEPSWMAVPNSADGPLVKIVHCPMRDTAFRIRIPREIHNTSVQQFVVDLSHNVAEAVRVQIPPGTKEGDSIVIELPKAGVTFGVVLPTGHYGKYITVRVPSELQAFREQNQTLQALTNGGRSSSAGGGGGGGGDRDGANPTTALVPLEPEVLLASNVELRRVIREIFESIDVDGSGSIERAEVQQLLVRLTKSSSDRFAAGSLFDQIDTNHDTVIDPREFETFILKQVAHTARLNQPALLERLMQETQAYCAEVTVTNDLEAFTDFLAAVQVPLGKEDAKTIWKFLIARSGDQPLSVQDYVSVFRHALNATTATSADEVDPRLARALKAVAAVLCTNELLRAMRGIINTPSNFAQPLLARLCRRSRGRLSAILNRDPYFIILQRRCVFAVACSAFAFAFAFVCLCFALAFAVRTCVGGL